MVMYPLTVSNRMVWIWLLLSATAATEPPGVLRVSLR
jgi:hypothetical protein